MCEEVGEGVVWCGVWWRKVDANLIEVGSNVRADLSAVEGDHDELRDNTHSISLRNCVLTGPQPLHSSIQLAK
ncbi:hypothetical protein HBH70_175840 [Parastagonospora nodorum]|nr:hypothetical protein HBH52_195720 [Parastagonospora nodorum]KAH4081869.1 hypothetical protein HBH48_194410 [Parastagonospora nodorum]KAH4092628.1 hypothetical protein HBH46_182070 [Parastagonospora nodorum]KAH4159281.1 hypothetical protein HBH43_189530 [Parastagonospora nodorum]KAH4264946.1 hypothetical protein HBI04_185400 [Parastagonospora nodorum]